jgi:DNA-binding transcriptional ArsR family regulator
MIVCEALADERRVRIVELLARQDLTAGEIAEQFTISRPAVSKHLKVLRSAGLVNVTAEANRRIYRLEPRPLSELADWLESQWTQWERRLDALGRHLDAKARSGARRGRS